VPEKKSKTETFKSAGFFQFPSENVAQIIFNSFASDEEAPRVRSERMMELDGNRIKFSIEAKTEKSVGKNIESMKFCIKLSREILCSASKFGGKLSEDENQADEWEVDFSSRPLLDNRGKRVWEIMVCDPRRTFEHSEYVPNNKVNSGTLKAVVEKLLDRKGARKPRVVRFFRGQMITIITKAFQDLGLKAVASRRCFTIMNWLDERLPTVYQRDPRFDANIGLSGALRGPIEAPPSRLPDALRGETWEFVELPLAAVQREAALLGKGTEFGASFDFEAAGVGDLPPDTPVPGVAVFSRRSKPLAGWTAGLELTAITSDEKQACLLLESGFSDKWYYGGWTDPKLASEGVAWEKAKQKCRGLHFLAVQQDDQSDVTDGFWVLLKREPPQV